jgi:hypothetical protein
MTTPQASELPPLPLPSGFVDDDGDFHGTLPADNNIYSGDQMRAYALAARAVPAVENASGASCSMVASGAEAWRPIETAPRGVPVLVQFHAYNNKANGLMQQVAWFFEGEWRPYPDTEGTAHADRWKPLPHLSQVAQWIPVSERLPDEWQAVLAAAPDGVWWSVFRPFAPDGSDNERRMFTADALHDMTEELPGVTHWMPLPPPPSSEAADKEASLRADRMNPNAQEG